MQFEVGGAKRVWWAFLFPPWVERNFRRMRKGPNHKTLSCSVTTGLIRLISLVWVAGWSTNYRASFTTVRFTVDLQRRRRRRKSRTKTTGFRHVWCLDPWVYEYSYEYMNIYTQVCRYRKWINDRLVWWNRLPFTLKLIIFQQRHVPKCFIPFIPNTFSSLRTVNNSS